MFLHWSTSECIIRPLSLPKEQNIHTINMVTVSLTRDQQFPVELHEFNFHYKWSWMTLTHKEEAYCVSYAESVMFQLGRDRVPILNLVWNFHCEKGCCSGVSFVKQCVGAKVYLCIKRWCAPKNKKFYETCLRTPAGNVLFINPE